MCVVVGKYFPEIGWVIAKNRDRNYKPILRIRKSWRRDIERLYIWDEKTKYAEGINEYGVGIVSASVLVKDDEEERHAAGGQDILSGSSERTYYSPDGLRIRTALFETNALNCVKRLIELEIPGNTIVADKETCFLLEATTKDKIGNNRYVYAAREIPKNSVVVRTNHGIILPWTGYSKDIPSQKASRNSSEIRYKKVSECLPNVENMQGILDCLSQKDDKNPQLNPLRIDTKKGAMRTTGQILMVPGEKTLHYRPVWCDTGFNMENLNKEDEKTYFEIVSSRKLHTLKEHLDKEKINVIF